MSYKKQKVLAIHQHMGSTPVSDGIRVAPFSFLCCVVLFVFCLSSSCILCTQCCQFLWIGHSCLLLRVSLTFMYTVTLCILSFVFSIVGVDKLIVIIINSSFFTLLIRPSVYELTRITGFCHHRKIL